MNQQKKEEDRLSSNSQKTVSPNILEEIKQKYNLTEQQLAQLLKNKEESLPIHIFDNPILSSLETIVKYLKENKNLKHSKIAKKLNRNTKTIWATYQKAKQKHPETFKEQETEITIPLNLFHNRTLGVLEHITKHLKEDYDFNYTEIAKLLNRSPKTIWTTYKRANKKE